ncbi:hypothetical protein OUZ56_025271 [Daphnia magna]|uniref:Uncharacterized protein n=1 Tax=Daphnia magna TaxID=35525 RepID=A0ABQ9ZJC4_9CRUS|nr:hypothetical protein OUZ56_025271 [Daphnia magna]
MSMQILAPRTPWTGVAHNVEPYIRFSGFRIVPQKANSSQHATHHNLGQKSAFVIVEILVKGTVGLT